MAPSFSIVIPTYQRREVVCDAVRALCRATYDGPVEIIVVDDGSADGTGEAVSALACPFPLKIISQPNGGAARARNRGAAEARHDILLFLDDDMICEPDILQQHARSHLDGAEAVIGDVFLDPASPPGFMADSNQRWIDSTRNRDELTPFDVFTGQLSVRRSVFERLGGFDPAYTSGEAFSNEDADLGVSLLAACDIRHNPAAVTYHRYMITPRELIRRAPLAARGDLQFMRKHPRFTAEILEARGISKPLTRYAYRPLAMSRTVTKILGSIAVVVADVGLRTPWRSNRNLARLFSGARSVAYWSAMKDSGWFPTSDQLLVLAYHAIADQSDDPVLAPYGVPLKRFTEQIDWLLGKGYVFIGPDLLISFLERKAALPRRAAFLTFDDGYPELLDLAREVLEPRKIEAMVAVVTGAESNAWDQEHGARPVKLLTLEQLRQLRSHGVEIGSHSRSHRPMTKMGEEELDAEAAGSMADLAAGGLPRPRFFTYPYGSRDGATIGAVERAGYLAAFGPEQGRVNPDSRRYDLPRVMIFADDVGWRFRLKISSPELRTEIDRIEAGLRRRLAKPMSFLRD